MATSFEATKTTTTTGSNGQGGPELDNALHVLAAHNPGAAALAESVLGRDFAKEPAPEWDWRDLAQAYEPKGERLYAIDGVLPLPSLSILYGAPGSLKTMLCMDQGLCVAAGKPWLAGLPGQNDAKAFGVMPCPVLWVDVDNGKDRLERRLAALGKGHDVPSDAPFAYVSFPDPSFVASKPESIQHLTDAALKVGAKLIYIDNLGTISGGCDENSSQMVEVMAGLRRLAETTGAAVVVIHHKGKGDRARMGDSLRGHSSIEAAIDLALLISREEGEDTIDLQSTKTRDVPIMPFSALWTYNPEGNELQNGRFYGLGRPDSQADNRTERARQAILDNLEDGMTQTAIVDMVKLRAEVGRNSALSVLRQLVREGKLETGEGARNAITYHKRAVV